MNTYVGQFNGVAVTAQQDFFEIAAPATEVVEIIEISLSQTTEVGDAAEEGLLLLFKTGATTTGSGGTTLTPPATHFGSAAASSTVKANNTTKASVGTILTLRAEAWNVRMPFLYLPPPEARIVLAPSRRFTVELATTPADSITVHGTITFRELG